MKQAPEDPEVPDHRHKYARVERERRFLLSALPATPDSVPTRHIQDRYFLGTTLRLRKMTELREGVAAQIYKLTQKIVINIAVPGQRLNTNT